MHTVALVLILGKQMASGVEYRTVRRLASQMLEEEVAFWVNYGKDPDGGFYGLVDERGRPDPFAEKGLVQQSRHLYTFTTLSEAWDWRLDLVEIAQEQYQFLRKYRNPETGLFYFKKDHSGERIVDAGSSLYANAQAIYALATYGKLMEDGEAVQLALDCFTAIDAANHDPIHGGYTEENMDIILFKGADKASNTHLHVMEALVALYQATGNAIVRERLDELLTLLSEKVYNPASEAFASELYYKDWSAVPGSTIGYGHALEAAWLMQLAGETLGKNESTLAESIAKRALSHSFDAAQGGVFNEADRDGTFLTSNKIWWPQYEALLALDRVYSSTLNSQILEQLLSILRWIYRKQNDRNFGVSHWEVDRRGEPRGNKLDLSSEWKASYHSVRGLIQLSSGGNEGQNSILVQQRP